MMKKRLYKANFSAIIAGVMTAALFERYNIPLPTDYEGKYTLLEVMKDGKKISDDEVFKVTALSKASYFGAVLKNENVEFMREDDGVKPVFTQFIKNDGALEEPTKYIAMTANAFDEDRKAATDCGMDGFISKPINLDEIIEVLHSVLGKK